MTDTETPRKTRFTGPIGLNFDAAQQDTVDLTVTRSAGRPAQDLSAFQKVLAANYKANAPHRKNKVPTRVAWINTVNTDAITTVKSRFSQAGKSMEPPLGATFVVADNGNGTSTIKVIANDRATNRGRKPRNPAS